MRVRNVPLRALGPYGRPRGLHGFSFGTPSQYQPNKDCPVGGSWEDWCDCVFTPGSELNSRCRSKPIGPAMFTAPWTEVGAGARGLPKPESIIANLTGAGLQIVSNLTGGVVQAPANTPVTVTLPPVQPSTGPTTVTVASAPATTGAPAEESSLFGLPKQAAYVGAGVLALGVAALAFSRR